MTIKDFLENLKDDSSTPEYSLYEFSIDEKLFFIKDLEHIDFFSEDEHEKNIDIDKLFNSTIKSWCPSSYIDILGTPQPVIIIKTK